MRLLTKSKGRIFSEMDKHCLAIKNIEYFVDL